LPGCCARRTGARKRIHLQLSVARHAQKVIDAGAIGNQIVAGSRRQTLVQGALKVITGEREQEGMVVSAR
jgi:hypothetical protein